MSQNTDKPTKNTAPICLPRNYWTYELIALAAAQYRTKTDFRRGNNRAYQAAQRNQIMSQVCAHMERPRRRLRWPKEELIALAKHYGTRMDFKKAAAGAYMAAHKWGWLDEVCAHMPKRSKRKDILPL